MSWYAGSIACHGHPGWPYMAVHRTCIRSHPWVTWEFSIGFLQHNTSGNKNQSLQPSTQSFLTAIELFWTNVLNYIEILYRIVLQFDWAIIVIFRPYLKKEGKSSTQLARFFWRLLVYWKCLHVRTILNFKLFVTKSQQICGRMRLK